ncbi:MAG: valine--tRNA ligase, partial [Candidatus Hydrogenedentes bacterium]|nr:valine--tRNA ligase [Candidatus Hydrogenedentota bacterium]
TPNPDREPYCIVIPPPNVTDVLHMGHAYNDTIQDVLIRHKRMRGFETLWIPGTDHAGIATQNVVERRLRQDENLTRHDLGREKFVERVWEWKEKYGSTIIRQIKEMGNSCDWSRTAFTMDEHLSKSVLEVFIRWYEAGLIYRGKYIINWCTRCHTALSDEEVEHRDQQGHLWHIRYPFEDGSGHVVVATTRPETMLGDVAVAVNPEDDRYADIKDKTPVLPILGRKLVFIEDEFVDPKFGTGAVKVTPAHDPNDFDMGQRHGLTPINILNGDGTLNDEAGPYAGMDVYSARAKLVADLESSGYLEKVEDHTHAVGHCYRCDTIIEPYLSTQWFVKMKTLAEPALEAVRDGRIKFHPEKWTNVYCHWMENIRDWCISRQLWWGHRIPVYYCDDCDEVMVAKTAPAACTKCGSVNIRQDEDVLDTWFSSQLWPFSTLGWPEQTADLEYYYPTNTLVTASEIIFFWVARMVMAGMYFCGDVPYTDVVVHGTVRDSKGRKMSKSLGNGIDPLKMVEKFSADAVRFSLLMLAPDGSDLRLATSDFEIGRNFSNKIWNAYRFLRLKMGDDVRAESIEPADLRDADVADRWIMSRLANTTRSVTDAIDKFRLNTAATVLYDFIWHQFCDWYVEMSKKNLDAGSDVTRRVAIHVLRESLKLLHPLMPFITEELFLQIPAEDRPKSIMIDRWPEVDDRYIDTESESAIDLVQRIVVSARNIRSEMNVPPSRTVPLLMRPVTDEYTKVIDAVRGHIADLARCEPEMISDLDGLPKACAKTFLNELELYVPLEGIIDIEVEKERLAKEAETLRGLVKKSEGKLANANFVERAPAEVVDAERARLAEYKDKVAKLEESLAGLG